MLQVRQGVFETNSSSTHSISICTFDEFKKLERGELLYVADKDLYVTPEEAKEINANVLEKSQYDEFCEDFYWDYKECCAMPYRSMGDYDNYEYFHKTKALQDGQVVVAWGYYGEDY